MNQKIIINADDVGMHPSVDRAIAQLAKRGTVSSASVMSLGTPCPDALAAMLASGIDLGVHLDFTSELATHAYGKARTVKSLIAETWTRRLKTGDARRIIDDQLGRFESLVGKAPSFIDGHEHIHQFPVIRESLMQALAERYAGRHFFIRNTMPRGWHGAKAAIIGCLGAHEMGKLLQHYQHRCNADFLGVYDFSPSSDPERLWSGWIERLKYQGSLIMCHPSLAPALEGDAIGKARVKEFQFMISDRFSELLTEKRIEIAGWQQALA